MGRFASTVPYYRRFRPPYPPVFFRRLAGALHLDGTQALVDLGCGPGLLALGFAPFTRKVVGVDPEAAMLADARQAAKAADVPLRLVHGHAHTVPPQIGRFEVATIGRALHWMPRRLTVARLNTLIVPGGHVLVCNSSPAEAETPWAAKYDAFRHRVATNEDRNRYRRKWENFFVGSAFRFQRTVTVRIRHTVTIESLVGRLFSMSNTSPTVLGTKTEATAERLRKLLAPFADGSGKLTEVVEAKATILRHEP